MLYQILPFHDSDDLGYAMVARKSETVSATPDRSLYQQIIDAQSRGEPSLVSLPVELLIDILVEIAFSSPCDARALALTSSWTSEVTQAARLRNVSIRSYRDLRSFHTLVHSSPHAAGRVRTLWISTNAGSDMQESTIPRIVEACYNLDALACEFTPLLNTDLHPLRLARPFHFTLTNNVGLYNFATHFPAMHLPNLTHLAMGSPLSQANPYSPPCEHRDEIRRFADMLDHHSLQLAMAVLVLWPWPLRRPTMRRNGPQFSPIPQHTRELVQTARDCSARSNITVYCASHAHRELRFWDACARAGEDIWSLAEKQMALFPDTVNPR
ncbi:hypothetical protein K438DRAFT_1771937 [Mycena galopus ATCC 62051]|nr:hypothetical protein K438DRAFT_1771937 [Mycena galopus ATCC 62051]